MSLTVAMSVSLLWRFNTMIMGFPRLGGQGSEVRVQGKHRAVKQKPRIRFRRTRGFRKESRGKAHRADPDRASGDLKMNRK